MNREEQIKHAAYEYINSDAVRTENMQLAFGDFINGAEWADKHQHNTWISVEDRMPEITYPSIGESRFVFVHVVNKDTGSEWIELPAKYNERLHDWQTNDFTWIGKRSGVVTHWMQIPTIPKNN